MFPAVPPLPGPGAYTALSFRLPHQGGPQAVTR